MPVESLGSAYLGGFSLGELARAGRVEELVEGALDRADRLFLAPIATRGARRSSELIWTKRRRSRVGPLRGLVAALVTVVL